MRAIVGTRVHRPVCARSAPGLRKHAPYNARMGFVHLRAHTEFSVVDGLLRIDEMVAAAAPLLRDLSFASSRIDTCSKAMHSFIEFQQ